MAIANALDVFSMEIANYQLAVILRLQALRVLLLRELLGGKGCDARKQEE